MESDLVSKAECAYAHIECDPEINKPHIDIETFFGYQKIADDIDRQCRHAEPDEDRGFAQTEESCECNNQKQDDCIDQICESFNPGKIQTDILLIKLHFKYIPLIFSLCE
jgi:hypothetical protein